MLQKFITADSYSGDVEVPLSLNRYAYVGDDPTGFTDPTGHNWWNPFSWGHTVAAWLDHVWSLTTETFSTANTATTMAVAKEHRAVSSYGWELSLLFAGALTTLAASLAAAAIDYATDYSQAAVATVALVGVSLTLSGTPAVAAVAPFVLLAPLFLGVGYMAGYLYMNGYRSTLTGTTSAFATGFMLLPDWFVHLFEAGS